MQNKKSLFSLSNLVISLAVVAVLLVIVTLYAEPVLRISTSADELPFVANRKMNLLADYLQQKIGMKVEYRPMRNGDALVESLLFKELDLVWIDGPHLARARSSSNDVMPIVQRAEDQRALAGMPPDRAYSWAVRAGLDRGLRQKLTDAFLTMHMDSGKGMEILGYQHTSRFVPARADDGNIDETGTERAGYGGTGFDGSVTERTMLGRPLPR
jgi:ABC-type phosphate/phosphonate transport system substrate-binding protein